MSCEILSFSLNMNHLCFSKSDGFVKSPSAALYFILALLNSRFARRLRRFNRVNHCSVAISTPLEDTAPGRWFLKICTLPIAGFRFAQLASYGAFYEKKPECSVLCTEMNSLWGGISFFLGRSPDLWSEFFTVPSTIWLFTSSSNLTFKNTQKNGSVYLTE